MHMRPSSGRRWPSFLQLALFHRRLPCNGACLALEQVGAGRGGAGRGCQGVPRGYRIKRSWPSPGHTARLDSVRCTSDTGQGRAGEPTCARQQGSQPEQEPPCHNNEAIRLAALAGLWRLMAGWAGQALDRHFGADKLQHLMATHGFTTLKNKCVIDLTIGFVVRAVI